MAVIDNYGKILLKNIIADNPGPTFPPISLLCLNSHLLIIFFFNTNNISTKMGPKILAMATVILGELCTLELGLTKG
jgi:hypothetical protein